MTSYEKYLISTGKTEPKISIFEHSNNVFQILCYLIEKNNSKVKDTNLLKVAALLHDIGKIDQDIRGEQWIHAPYTFKYLDDIINNRQFQLVLQENGININVDRGILLQICEEHHNPSPRLLHACKDALLVSIADILASCLEAGMTGNIQEMLRTNPYTQINLELVKNLDLNNGLDGEIHRIDLPSNFVEDVLLADMVFHTLSNQLKGKGIDSIFQKNATLWLVGPEAQIKTALESCYINPGELYGVFFDENIYGSILNGLPPVGSIQIDSIRYLLVNEAIAKKFAIALYTRDSVRKLFEKYDLSHLIDKAGEIFANSLEEAIETLWKAIRKRMKELYPKLNLPERVTDRIADVVNGNLSRNELFSIRNNVENVHKDIKELLKLFDATGNYYRSLTNILLELLKIQKSIESGEYGLVLKDYILFDRHHLTPISQVDNALLCPVCRRFRQETESQALITGNPKMDSIFQIYRRTRSQIKICKYCFLSGYIDLPLATISKEGQSIGKRREFLLVTSPLPRNILQNIIDFTKKRAKKREEDSISNETQEIEHLEAMLGFEGYDNLSILGISNRRLSNLKGFALPTINTLVNFVGIRMPIEGIGGLVGEEKVSGAVKRELIKAVMYDLYRVTQSGSLHYNVITDHQFSVNGQPVSLEEMYRANMAYRIADRYTRGGKYATLDSGIFMLLLSDPRQAVTLILRRKHRENRGQYSPGEDKIREVIEMAEEIAKEDWRFNLGLKIVEILVDLDLLPQARSFWKNPGEQFTGIELVKWLRRFKMVKDEPSAKAWGNCLINALKRGDIASKEFLQKRGIPVQPPNEQMVAKVITLVEEIITECKSRNYKLYDFSRDVADMDYYLLFYHNKKAKEVAK